MNTDELTAIRDRCNAATPGPWERRTERNGAFWHETWVEEKQTGCDETVCGDVCIRDADFIAHARADIPALLDEVERLRAALEAVEFIQGGIGDPSWDFCPWCISYRGKHRADCPRQIALGVQP